MEMIALMYTEVIPWALVLMMTGMGLSLTPADIRRVTVYPKAVSIGLAGQLPVAAGMLVRAVWPVQAARAAEALPGVDHRSDPAGIDCDL